MGNIVAHAKISAHVIGNLTKIRPDEDYLYLELGNFLTDLDQFRDPYAYLGGRRAIRETVINNIGIPIISPLLAYAVDTWRNELFGSGPSIIQYDGSREMLRKEPKLAAFFQDFALFMTHLSFASDSPVASLLAPVQQFKNLSLQLLPPAELERVFEWAFEQYYPH